MKRIPKDKRLVAEVLWRLRDMGRLEASVVTDFHAKHAWGAVQGWAEGMALHLGFDLNDFDLPGVTGPETAKRRSDAAGSIRKDDRTGTGAPGATAGRLAELDAKITSGIGLTMAERGERQGLIFNHTGKTSRPTNLERRKTGNH